VGGHVCQAIEAAVVDLLLARSTLEGYQTHGSFVIDCRSGLVECDVSILAYTEKYQIDWRRSHLRGVAPGFLFRVRRPVDQMDCAGPNDVEQTIGQVPAEASGIADVQSDIFIHVKGYDACPVDAGLGDQTGECAVLGRGRGEDDPDAFLCAKPFAQELGRGEGG